MTPNEQLLFLRMTHSRRTLSELTGLGEGKIWNIERGRKTSDAETTAIAAAYAAAVGAEDVPEPVQRPAAAPALPPMPEPIPVPTPPVSEDQEAWVRRAVGHPPLPPLDVGTPGRVVTDLRLHPGTGEEMEAVEGDALTVTPTPRQMSAEDGLRRISNSEIQTFKRCRRKWWLAWHRDLRLRHESPVGVRQVGDRIHRALRAWYVPDAAQRVDPRDALEDLIMSDWHELKVLPSEGEITQESVAAQFQKEADLERVIVDGYLKWLAETGADADYVVIEPEAYLEAPVPGVTGVLVIGRLDVRIRRISDGLRLFEDHKIVGDFTRSTRVLHLDEQVLTYMLLERLQPDADEVATGALYNMLRRSKRTAVARPPFFQRVEVHHNATELDSFTRRLRGTVGQIEDVRWHLENGSSDPLQLVYPTPTPDCAWQCPFFAVCGMLDDGSRAEAAISRYYEKTDPTSYYVDQVPVTEGAE